MTFTQLGLRDELQQAVTEMGFTTPMPIQQEAIPILTSQATDLIGLAQTGTGKTGAFGLPLLNRLDPELKAPQGIILCPTRELCMQIVQELRQFAKHLAGARILAVYGGASISYQVNELRRGAQVIVATPGRLLDLIQRGVIDFEHVAVSVLDEADEMLDMGFQEDLDQILKTLPAERQTWMFSATMGREVAEIAKRHLKEPVEITIGSRNQAAANIEHVSFIVNQPQRYAALRRLIDMTPDIFGLIFCRTRRDTQELAEKLARDGYDAEPLHGDLTQAQRDQVMGRFRRHQVRLLIATDVAARGIDVDDITHIIHYQLPDDIDVYTHRSGRTARAGKSGFSFVFATPAERYRLRQIERRLKLTFSEQQVPDGLAVCHKRMVAMAQEFVAATGDEEMIDFLYPLVEAELSELDREKLIRHLIASELKRLGGAHLSSQNLNADRGAPPRERERHFERRDTPRGTPQADSRMQTFELNVGRSNGINEGAIVRLVCEYGQVESRQIGAIRMTPWSTLFEVANEVASDVRFKMRSAELDGNPVKIREAAAGAAARQPPRRPPHARPYGPPRRGPAAQGGPYPRKGKPYGRDEGGGARFQPRGPRPPHRGKGAAKSFPKK